MPRRASLPTLASQAPYGNAANARVKPPGGDGVDGDEEGQEGYVEGYDHPASGGRELPVVMEGGSMRGSQHGDLQSHCGQSVAHAGDAEGEAMAEKVATMITRLREQLKDLQEIGMSGGDGIGRAGKRD